MPVTAPGAQRASRRPAILRSLVAALLAAFIITPIAAPSEASAVTAIYDTPWLSVEQYYLKLVNCTRTGGWVRSDGSCAGYGTGRYSKYVPPLKFHSGIAAKVSRPYVKLLAVQNICSHFADGDPGYRLRRAGYTSYRWGENLGCRSGYSSVYKAVLASHLYMQAEKSTNGGHWRNMKNPLYTYAGIGVWNYHGRVRVVTDFYRP